MEIELSVSAESWTDGFGLSLKGKAGREEKKGSHREKFRATVWGIAVRPEQIPTSDGPVMLLTS